MFIIYKLPGGLCVKIQCVLGTPLEMLILLQYSGLTCNFTMADPGSPGSPAGGWQGVGCGCSVQPMKIRFQPPVICAA